jgi:hydroxymethylglutaryl-CoA reductase
MLHHFTGVSRIGCTADESLANQMMDLRGKYLEAHKAQDEKAKKQILHADALQQVADMERIFGYWKGGPS